MWDLFDMPWETTEGYKHILLVKCHFTKYTWAYALKTKTALETAKHVFSTFRNRATPKRFHSDNGPEFVNSVMHTTKTGRTNLVRFAYEFRPGESGDLI